ncbi:hypothetical protein GDO78_015072 [Eleutherodactylus coqui]|uniref:Uncharacterized protein n=1 Tax=Eleutherodactylus coqui TaxID=57060 RepID=A0A8J6JPH6_ELECQ|nr:hypothetical protein GDO78_015072 [Eleutherodactylus coqui]
MAPTSFHVSVGMLTVLECLFACQYLTIKPFDRPLEYNSLLTDFQRLVAVRPPLQVSMSAMSISINICAPSGGQDGHNMVFTLSRYHN